MQKMTIKMVELRDCPVCGTDNVFWVSLIEKTLKECGNGCCPMNTFYANFPFEDLKK